MQEPSTSGCPGPGARSRPLHRPRGGGDLSRAARYARVHRLHAVTRAEVRERKIAEYVEMLARGETPYPQKKKAPPPQGV